MSNEYDPAGERPGRRLNLDDMTAVRPPDETQRHLNNALTSACMALQLAEHRSQALSLWHALRSLLEAKFGREEGR